MQKNLMKFLSGCNPSDLKKPLVQDQSRCHCKTPFRHPRVRNRKLVGWLVGWLVWWHFPTDDLIFCLIRPFALNKLLLQYIPTSSPSSCRHMYFFSFNQSSMGKDAISVPKQNEQNLRSSESIPFQCCTHIVGLDSRAYQILMHMGKKDRANIELHIMCRLGTSSSSVL